jgi:hypothetical protein
MSPVALVVTHVEAPGVNVKKGERMTELQTIGKCP